MTLTPITLAQLTINQIYTNIKFATLGRVLTILRVTANDGTTCTVDFLDANSVVIMGGIHYASTQTVYLVNP